MLRVRFSLIALCLFATAGIVGIFLSLYFQPSLAKTKSTKESSYSICSDPRKMCVASDKFAGNCQIIEGEKEYYKEFDSTGKSCPRGSDPKNATVCCLPNGTFPPPPPTATPTPIHTTRRPVKTIPTPTPTVTPTPTPIQGSSQEPGFIKWIGKIATPFTPPTPAIKFTSTAPCSVSNSMKEKSPPNRNYENNSDLPYTQVIYCKVSCAGTQAYVSFTWNKGYSDIQALSGYHIYYGLAGGNLTNERSYPQGAVQAGNGGTVRSDLKTSAIKIVDDPLIPVKQNSQIEVAVSNGWYFHIPSLPEIGWPHKILNVGSCTTASSSH